ncbi:MAG: aminoacyl-tRNA hydrolase [Desulfovibrio sp.]|nr:aminoacyl-tRNA hydrolase [Desulfovibrio sp.]
MYQAVIVGLGNPGPEYAHTRHNCGFDTLDCLLKEAREEGRVRELNGAKFSCELWQVDLPRLSCDLLCAKPLTFMNASGRCVQPLLAWHKVGWDKLIVIHDELDIPAGQIRCKFGGGNAGHNGLKSISAQLGSNDFLRIRIGIGRPPHKNTVINWVLGHPTSDERENIALAEAKALDVLACYFQKGLEAAVSLARSVGKND